MYENSGRRSIDRKLFLEQLILSGIQLDSSSAGSPKQSAEFGDGNA